MKKQIIAAGIVGLMMLAGITIMAEAATEDDPLVTDLIAGQNHDVGNVSVWNDGTNLYVKYETDDPWVLTETHLSVNISETNIPQTKKGNPIPGQFEYYNETHDLVDEYLYTIALEDLYAGWENGLVIAAHACVLDTSSTATMWIYSDATETYVAHNGSTCPGAYMERTGTAVWAYDGAWGTLADNYEYGQWIWESYYVLHPVCGDVVNFTKTFDIPGQPVTGNLQIGVDNAYNAYLNGNLVGGLGLNSGWYNSNLKEEFVESGFVWDISNYPLLNLEEGENTFLFACANEYNDIDDGDGSPGTILSNPGGLIYEAEITYYDHEETAWGDGTEFEKRGKGKGAGNWGMWFTYEVTPDFEVLGLLWSNDKATWYDVNGTYSDGYNLTLNGDNSTWYYITTNSSSLVTNMPLDDGSYEFYLDITTVPTGFYTYWQGRNVFEGCPGSWEPYMWDIINGTMPIFYFKVDGANYMLVDGLQYYASGGIVEDYLRVDGDYPTGIYHFTGVISSGSHTTDIVVMMEFL